MLILTLTVLIFPQVVRCIEFTHQISLDADNKYKMWWTFDDTNITIKIQVATSGWIAWGISPNGKMPGSDIVLGWVTEQGDHFFSDRHALGHSVPPIDKKENYHLIKISEEDGTTTMTFTRKIKLCNNEDLDITGDTVRVVYAWNDKDPLNEDSILQHDTRGSKSVLLLDYGNKVRNNDLPVDYKTYDLRMNDYKMPAKDTEYRCKALKLPKMSGGKNHLIRIDPLITKGSEGVVHHMLLYHCFDMHEDHFNKTHDCLSPNMPDDLHNCRANVIAAWATGGDNFYFPEEAGLSLNAQHDPKYILLEIHYDNPSLRTDIVDSSGLRIYYTPTTRKYDAAVLAAGSTPRAFPIQPITQIIPQNQQNFTSYGYCNSKCLDIDSNNGTPQMFAVGLHSHLYGRQITVRLVRDSDGVETARICEDLKYDFNFQEFRYLPELISIPVNHSILVECQYNTTTRKRPLLSGTSTREEMCFAFIYYYPKIKTRFCTSFPHYNFWLQQALGWKFNSRINKINGHNFTNSIGALVSAEFWAGNQSLVDAFVEAGKKYPHIRWCTYEDPDVSPNYRNVFRHQQIKEINREDVCGIVTRNLTKNGADGEHNNAANDRTLLPVLISLLLFYSIV